MLKSLFGRRNSGGGLFMPVRSELEMIVGVGEADRFECLYRSADSDEARRDVVAEFGEARREYMRQRYDSI